MRIKSFIHLFLLLKLRLLQCFNCSMCITFFFWYYYLLIWLLLFQQVLLKNRTEYSITFINMINCSSLIQCSPNTPSVNSAASRELQWKHKTLLVCTHPSFAKALEINFRWQSGAVGFKDKKNRRDSDWAFTGSTFAIYLLARVGQ